ncbi:MAG: prolyl oligopeptidase family serine peptidase [Gemmatimonas sp.]|jgi:dipeptidyl aminopeptidase/acylaminoacyl peptidase|uniref:alpha/beta hydrolase family protein n=1 Tax=Gemmatimonas sp. TaxID=1962908 RepID=UPI00391F11C3|nr:prolyl oligopeptidase family serine peptidase [Gemmatimonadota bacterium]
MPRPFPVPCGIRDLIVLGLLSLPAALPAQNRPGANAATPASGAVAKPDLLADEGYVSPPEAIARLVTAPRETNATFATPSPGNRRFFMRTVSDGLPALRLVGKAHHNLGGLQIDHRANRERTLTMRSSAGIEVTEWETGRTIAVAVPAGARVGSPVWSPDGMQIAFLALFDDATQLYVADAATGKARPVSPRTVLATAVTQPEWTADGVSLVTVLVPDGRGPEPKEPVLATGPMVRLNENNKLKTRTYADLVTTPYERELLAYHLTGQLAVVNTRTRAIRRVGAPGLIRSVDPAPDAQGFRVTYTEKPFSYVLPVSAYGTRDVILDASGTEVREIAKRPLREGEEPADPTDPTPRPQATPFGPGRGAAADTGKRNIAWHPFAPGLLYAQLAPAPTTGNGNRPAGAGAGATARTDSAALARRTDRLMHWKPPFDSASASVLYETPNRITNARFNDAGTILFVSETGTGGTFEQAIFLTENNAKFTVIAPRARGRGDSAAAPSPPAAVGPQGPGGRFGGNAGGVVTRPGRRGGAVVMVSTDGKFVFTQGSTPDSLRMPKAFVEKIEIRTGTRTRVYEGTGDVLETISAPLDDDFTRAIVQRESPTVVPQSFALTLSSKAATQLTTNRDLMPEISQAVKKTVTARRADGYSFTVRVTLPADYKDGTRLPGMFWFYPREYDNQEAYNRSLTQGAAAANRFPTFGPRSLQFLVTQGYAVVEPDAPIFASEGQLPNDNYVVDLRNNLAAVIDALDTLAIIDRQRLGIGGHSYGAFSTVNAMVHTPFFKAGIAGDGAYNRTLTPNGFQSERRDLWQGRQTYLEMSPFLYADQLNGALLMYHSTEDQNVGTDPINSTKLFHALQGLGKTSSLYLYPYEDHGPIAKETVLDQWARWVAWLDKYVKNANGRKITTM